MKEKRAMLLQLNSGMRTVIIISKCTALSKKKVAYPAQFHFKGSYDGHYLTRIDLKFRSELNLIKGEEYLLYVEVDQIVNEILYGTIIKSKRLEDCWDKS